MKLKKGKLSDFDLDKLIEELGEEFIKEEDELWESKLILNPIGLKNYLDVINFFSDYVEEYGGEIIDNQEGVELYGSLEIVSESFDFSLCKEEFSEIMKKCSAIFIYSGSNDEIHIELNVPNVWKVAKRPNYDEEE